MEPILVTSDDLIPTGDVSVKPIGGKYGTSNRLKYIILCFV